MRLVLSAFRSNGYEATGDRPMAGGVRHVCVGFHHIIGNPEVVGNLKIVCFATGVDDGAAPVEAAPQLPIPCTRRPSRCHCPQGSFVRGAREVAGEVGPTQATPTVGMTPL